MTQEFFASRVNDVSLGTKSYWQTKTPAEARVCRVYWDFEHGFNEATRAQCQELAAVDSKMGIVN